MSGVFRPSCVAHIRVRFDEALLAELPTPEPESTTAAPAATGATPTLGTLAGARTPPTASAAAQARGTGRPEVLAPDNGRTSFVMNRVPKRCAIELNGWRLAHTFELTLNWRDLPIDARTVRAASVELHLGTVSDDDFAAGMRGERDATGRLLSVLRTRDAAGTPRRDTRVFVGIVDEWETGHGEDGSEVRLSGRDLRSLFIDTPMPPGIFEGLPTDQGIDAVVHAIVHAHPAGGAIHVRIDAAEWPDGRLSAALAVEMAPRHRRGARGNRRAPRANPRGDSAQLTFWDAIVRMCFLAGAVPYFDGEELRVRPSRSLFEQQVLNGDRGELLATPFADGRPREVDGATFAVRRLVYGAGVGNMKFKRRLGGGNNRRTVRVISVVHSRASRDDPPQVEAFWPPRSAPVASRTHRVAPGNRVATEDVATYTVPDVTDPERLAQIARAYFEEIGRNELAGEFDSPVLSSLGGDNQDPDLLRLRPGHAVEFFARRTNPAPNALVASFGDFDGAAFARVVEDVAARLGDVTLARVIVGTARGMFARLLAGFRVATVKYDWSSEGAVKVAFDFQNYVVPRFHVAGPGDTATPSVVQATVTPRRRARGAAR